MEGMEYELSEIDIGSNYIDATLCDDDGQEVEIKFYKIPSKQVIDTFKIYGIDIQNECEFTEYEY